MTATPALLRSPARDDALELLRKLVAGQVELVAEVRGLRADLRKRDKAPALIAALAEFFGEAPFTVAGLLKLADEDPHAAIANALGAAIDLNASARSRATALGALLARLPQVEIARRHQNAAIFRLCACPD
jgi:hypothetical protein